MNQQSVKGFQQEFCELTKNSRGPTLPTVDPIGTRLRERRVERVMTMMQLAEVSGVDVGAISRLESGKMPNPSFKVLSKLARALDLSLDELNDLAEPLPV